MVDIRFFMIIVPIILVSSLKTYGAQNEPIQQMIDKTQLLERVQLIGVIASGGDKSGVAVIKDAMTGKTFVIKTGEGLPGVPDMVLSSVQRELAVFKSNDKEFKVRMGAGAEMEEARSVEHDEDSMDAGFDSEFDGGVATANTGLFESWYEKLITSGNLENRVGESVPSGRFEEDGSRSPESSSMVKSIRPSSTLLLENTPEASTLTPAVSDKAYDLKLQDDSFKKGRPSF